MKILHYTLGLPPLRSGGLTKYALDLMEEQSLDTRDSVFLLHPGKSSFFSRERKIHSKLAHGRIKVFEITNPTLVPLLYGVSQPDDITNDSRRIEDADLELFFETVQPDIFHIHTLMGLPPELIKFFKKKGVSILYTSHDYYGICPKVNLVDHEGHSCDVNNCSNCDACNKNAPSSLFLKIRNSETVLNLKNNKFLRKLALK